MNVEGRLTSQDGVRLRELVEVIRRASPRPPQRGSSAVLLERLDPTDFDNLGLQFGCQFGGETQCAAFAAATREFHHRLCVYPQFGDPLSDLHGYQCHVRLGMVPPLAMRYGVLEEQRVVFVAAPPVLLHKSGGASG